jgi:MATE family multidrug resistance protein
MALSLVIFVIFTLVLEPNFGYHGLWVSLIIFMAARGLTLAATYPNIEKNLKVVTVTNTN